MPHPFRWWDGVTFFIVTHMVLCFEFVTKTVLIAHQCLAVAEQCLPGAKAFSHSAGWECSWDGWKGWRDTPSRQMSCSAIKTNPVPKNNPDVGCLAFQGSCCLETKGTSACLWEVVSGCVASLVCSPSPFPSLMKLSLSSPMSFLTFLLYSLPHPVVRGVSKGLCGCLAAGWGQPTTESHFITYGKNRAQKKVLW